jgi:general secretion pathway protein A
VLVGQSEFEQIIDQYSLRQLKQRIAIRATIVPFTERESAAYVKHRLAKAAVNGSPIFTSRALKKIVREAKGVPRNLNVLCDNALITGFGYKMKPVNTKVVNEVITDFSGEQEASLLKWTIASAAAALFIGGLFLISPYKGPVVSWMENLILPHKNLSIPRVENPAPAQTAVQKPSKEETKPSANRPEASQTEQAAPVREKMDTAEEKKSS